jgi:hypothetical protein
MKYGKLIYKEKGCAMNIRWDFASMTDKELMIWLHFAQEYRSNRYLKAIKDEIKRRWLYA